MKKKKEEISSWIQSASQGGANPNQYLPLTPPALPQDPRKEVPVAGNGVEATASDSIPTRQGSERSATPVNPRSPPTPDLTPPRKALQPSSPTPPSSIRNESSKADSFRTAWEQYAADDDTLSRTHLPWTLSNKLVEPFMLASSKEVGLGLNLESDEGSKTPTLQASRIVRAASTIEELDMEPRIVNDDSFVVSEPAAVQEVVMKPKTRHGKKVVTELWTYGSSPDDFQASLDRSYPSQSGSEQINHGPILKTVEDLAERFKWLNWDENMPHGPDVPDINGRRLSQLSATSTIVEATVYETPPRRRQRLRHSSKNPSLRTASSPLSGSNRSSLVSSETKPRLHHKKLRIAEVGNRTSVQSDSGVSMGLDLAKSVENAISTPEVPQRQSSLMSSLTVKPNRTLRRSQKPQRSTSRPATAPDVSVGYHELSRRKTRAMSAFTPSSDLSEIRGRTMGDFQPAVPTRASSLSAPTSKNASRATSLTSTSLHKHNVQQGLHLNNRDRSLETSKERAIPLNTPEKQTNEDLLGGLRPSSMLTRTPFSAMSMQSSTPGPFEVNEATAINIYPHNNNSLLVVQQTSRRGSEPARLTTRITDNVRIAVNPTEAMPHLSFTRQVPSSPLHTPRKIAKTPAVMLIPPTPFSRTSMSDDADFYRGRSSKSDPPAATGPMSRARRALSARRYSETIITPLTRSLSLHRRESLSGTTRYRVRRRTDNADGNEDLNKHKLSPFWRPRGFWNDLDDEDDESEDRTQESGAPYVRNTLGLPQTRVIAGPVALARRIGSLKRRKQQQQQQESPSAAFGVMGQASGSFGGRVGQSAANRSAAQKLKDLERRVGVVARFEHAVHKVGRSGEPIFSVVQDAYDRLRANRVEERLERQRERLKRNIGAVIVREDSGPLY